ncbi:MAG: glycosyltransferase [Gammaproteobacteria bacterium]|nr:MAG: glycosyltransferase [Gammaproteobacteria bacterium]
MLTGTVERAAGAGYGSLSLVCTPDCAHPALRDLARAHRLEMASQRGADLGERMCHALGTALAQRPRAVLIGTDAPSLGRDDLVAARAALADGAEAVFVPAEDGGYLLAGFSQRVDPALFSGIEWGSNRVWRQTRERLEALSVRWRALPTRWDVDRPADVDRWLREEGLTDPGV